MSGHPSDALFEEVLFEGGRGVLVVPPRHRPADAVRRVLVCWRNAREAARAVAEALPFLETATKVTILMVDPEPKKLDTDNAPTADIAKHICRFGAPVDVSVVERQGRDVSDVILDQARRASADLIVTISGALLTRFSRAIPADHLVNQFLAELPGQRIGAQ